MLSLLVASLAVGATALVSGSTVLCRRSEHVAPAQALPLVYTLKREGSSSTVTVSSVNNKHVCEFRKTGTARMVHNLYRLYGVVDVAHSTREVALFYRNTVGNGGYIEFFSQPEEQNSILLSFLSRFQSAKQPEESAAPLRIYVSSKLTGDKYELVLDDSPVKYIWDAKKGELSRIVGTTNRFAAKLVTSDDGESHLYVHRDVINPYLAICNCLFFALQINKIR